MATYRKDILGREYCYDHDSAKPCHRCEPTLCNHTPKCVDYPWPNVKVTDAEVKSHIQHANCPKQPEGQEHWPFMLWGGFSMVGVADYVCEACGMIIYVNEKDTNGRK